MHDLANVSSWLQALSALLVVALGVLVGSIRPRTRQNLAFAAFAFSFGGQFLLTNVALLAYDQPLMDGHPWLEVGRFVLRVGVVVSALALALVFPVGSRRDEWRLLVAPGAISILVFAAGWRAVPTLTTTPWGAASVAAFVAWAAMMVGLQSLAALRFRAAADARSAHQLAFFAGALVLYTGFTATAGFDAVLSILTVGPNLQVFQVALIASHLIAAGLWIWASARGPASRMARDLALLTAGMMFLGILHAAAGYTFGIGVIRLLMVAVLGYAIVRHQWFGIDLKVRWTISKSTIAAVFIAVFFLASEAAQQFFGEAFQSAYVGIAAAGALVFTMAPLQRAAERLAERAVPGASAASLPAGVATIDPAARQNGGAAQDAYRILLQRFLQDRRVSRDEEMALAKAARGLGLAPDDAVRIRHEIEDQLAGGGT